jgi:predicted Zn-dependent protease
MPIRPSPRSSRKALAVSGLLGCAALSLSACGPLGGPIASAGTPISPAEAQEGAQYHPQFLAEFGGAMAGPHADYVVSVGKNVAVQSGLGNAREDFTVTLLNSPVNNAFAIPGGYVYVTRQLVGLMNNEAELAGVLGHEVGHVAARHSARRQQTAQQNQILGVLGAVVSGAVLGDSALGQSLQKLSLEGSQLLTLRYSRSQELEADTLGIQYLANAGYDQRAMGSVLNSLARQNALDARLQGRDASMPEWASTHPDPASRVQTALAAATVAGGNTNRDVFLTRISGLLYGDDPKQGVIEGQNFLHPDFRLSFTAPGGFYMVNSAQAVSINGQSGKGQLAAGALSGSLQDYVRKVFQALGTAQQPVAAQTLQSTTVNGIPAAYGTATVASGQQNVDVVVYAYDFGGGRAFHFLTVSAAGQAGVFSPMFQSMRRISASEAAAVVPRKIEIVTVRPGETVAVLARRMAYDTAQEERFRVLNGLGSADTLQAGQKVKLVVK